MKSTKITLALIAVIAIALFNGCAQAPQEGEKIIVTPQVSDTDSAALNRALEMKDASLCETIADPYLKSNCIDQIQSEQEKKENKQAEIEKIKEEAGAVSALVAEGNLEGCTGLELQKSRVDCEVNILLNQALQAKDPSVCDKASEEESREACASQYEFQTKILPAGAASAEEVIPPPDAPVE
jgi:hypothetical protein